MKVVQFSIKLYILVVFMMTEFNRRNRFKCRIETTVTFSILLHDSLLLYLFIMHEESDLPECKLNMNVASKSKVDNR